MPITYILLTLLTLGLLIALYLIAKRKKGEKAVCVIGEDCNSVLESKYNHLFGIVHNDIMGLLYYLAMIALIFLLKFKIAPAEWLIPNLKILAGVGAFMSVIFMYLQWRILKAWCFWCIISNINTWIIALLIFFYL